MERKLVEQAMHGDEAAFDAGKGLLVIRATDFPQTTPAELGGGVVYSATRHAKDQAALRAILNSIKLTPKSP